MLNELSCPLLKQLISINQAQQQLEQIRQTLNEEILFNLKDLYEAVSNNATSVTINALLRFTGIINHQGLYHMVQYYNGATSQNLSFIEFSYLFLSREDKLIAKMVLERQNMGAIPNYVLQYAKKILFKENQLHLLLLNFKNSNISNQNFGEWIDHVSNNSTFISQDKLTEYLIENAILNSENIKHSDCNSFMQIPLFRYLKQISRNCIKTSKVSLLLTRASKSREFLGDRNNAKDNNWGCSPKQKHISLCLNSNIRQEYQDCLKRQHTNENTAVREIKSIQKHLDRINPIHKIEHNKKINDQERLLEKHSYLLINFLKEMLWLQKQIEHSRRQLNLCSDFYPVIFYQGFHKDKKSMIIPSAFKDYLHSFQIHVDIKQIFIFFKRYSRNNDGKLDFNSFCKIFQACQSAYSKIQKNRLINCLEDIGVETKKILISLLQISIRNEYKMQEIKKKIAHRKINLRDIFSIIDTDEDGAIFFEDIVRVWKKYLNLEVDTEDLELFWFRFGLRNMEEPLKYEVFIKELLPKTPLLQLQSKKTQFSKQIK